MFKKHFSSYKIKFDTKKKRDIRKRKMQSDEKVLITGDVLLNSGTYWRAVWIIRNLQFNLILIKQRTCVCICVCSPLLSDPPPPDEDKNGTLFVIFLSNNHYLIWWLFLRLQSYLWTKIITALQNHYMRIYTLHVKHILYCMLLHFLVFKSESFLSECFLNTTTINTLTADDAHHAS